MTIFSSIQSVPDEVFRLKPDTRWRFVKLFNSWYGVDGHNPPLVRHNLVAKGSPAPCEFRAMGLPWPDLPMAIVGARSEGGVHNCWLRMTYTFYDPQTGRESKLAPWSNAMYANGNRIAVSGFQFPPPGAYHLRLYANTQGAPLDAFFVTEIPFVLSAVVDWSLDTLGLPRDTNEGGLPPIGELITTINNRLYIAGSSKKTYETTFTFTNGSKELTLTDTSAMTYDFPGKYLLGEHLLVDDFPDRRDIAMAYWDDVRYTGRLQYKWEEAGGDYVVKWQRIRPAVFWSGFYPGGAPLPESWATDVDVLYVPMEESEQITGMVGWGTPTVGTLVVFSKASAWTTSTRHEEMIRSEVETGTVSPDTVHVGYKGLIYYLGTDGQIYAFNGRQSERLSTDIQQILHDTVDLDRLSEAFAVYDPKTQRQFWWLPDRSSSGLSLFWWDHSAGQVFRSTLAAERAWEYVKENDTFVLCKTDTGDYFIIGYLEPGTPAGPLQWDSSKMPRPKVGQWTVGRVQLQFDEATNETLTLSLVDEDEFVVASDEIVIDRDTIRSFFRSKVGLWQIRLESDGTQWRLRSIDAELHTHRI